MIRSIYDVAYVCLSKVSSGPGMSGRWREGAVIEGKVKNNTHEHVVYDSSVFFSITDKGKAMSLYVYDSLVLQVSL